MSYDVISCHMMSYHVMSCHVMSCHMMSCYVMLCHVMSCHVMSRQVMSYHVISYHIISYHIISYHIILCYFTDYSVILIKSFVVLNIFNCALLKYYFKFIQIIQLFYDHLKVIAVYLLPCICSFTWSTVTVSLSLR